MFSSLVKGSGTWDGRLELLEDEIGKSTLDVLFPSISKTSKGTSFYNKSFQSAAQENAHLIPLPKTYLTRKGTIVLFASPNDTNQSENREFDKRYCNDCGCPETPKAIRKEQSQLCVQSPLEDKAFSRPKSMNSFHQHSSVGCRKNKVRPKTALSGIPSEPELPRAHPRITSAKPTPPTRALGKLPFRNLCSEFEKELAPKLETVNVAHPCSPEAQMLERNEIKTPDICTTNEQVHYDRITIPKSDSKSFSERSQGISRASSASRYSSLWTVDDVSLSRYDNDFNPLTDTEQDYHDLKYPESARTHRDSLSEAFDMMTSRPASSVPSSIWEKSSDNGVSVAEPVIDYNLGLPDEMSSQSFLDVVGRPVSAMQGSVLEPRDGDRICIPTEPARDDNNSLQDGRQSKVSSQAFLDVIGRPVSAMQGSVLEPRDGDKICIPTESAIDDNNSLQDGRQSKTSFQAFVNVSSRPVSSRKSSVRETLNENNDTYVQPATDNNLVCLKDGPLSKMSSQAFTDVVSQPVLSRPSSVVKTFSENDTSLVGNKMDNFPVVEDGLMSKASSQVCTSNAVPSRQDSVWENSSDSGESDLEPGIQDYPSIEDEQVSRRSSQVFYNKHDFYEMENFSSNDFGTSGVGKARTGSKDSLGCSSKRDFQEFDSVSRIDNCSTYSCARTTRVRSAPCSTKNGASRYSQKVLSRKILSAGLHKPSPTQPINMISPTPPATLSVRIPSATSVDDNNDEQEIVSLTQDVSERDNVQALAQEDIANHFSAHGISERDNIQELTQKHITDHSKTEDISEQVKTQELTQEGIANRFLNENSYERDNVQELYNEGIANHGTTEDIYKSDNIPLRLNEDEIENRFLTGDISERGNTPLGLNKDENVNPCLTEDISEQDNIPELTQDDIGNRFLNEDISERANILDLQQENIGSPHSDDEQETVQFVSCVSEIIVDVEGGDGSDEILEDSVVFNDDSVTSLLTNDQAGQNSMSKETDFIDGQTVGNDDPDGVAEGSEENPKTLSQLNEATTVLKTDPSGKQEANQFQSVDKKIPLNSNSLKPDKKTETNEKAQKITKSKGSVIKNEKMKREGGKLDVQGVGKAETNDMEVKEKVEINIQNKVDLSDLIEKKNTASKNKKSSTKKPRSPKPSRKKVVPENVESNLDVIPSVDENLLKFLESQDGTIELTDEALNQFAPVENFQEPDPLTELEDKSTKNTGAYSPSKVKKGTKKDAARKKKAKMLEKNKEAEDRKKKMAEEKEKREEELRLLQEREEEQRRLLEEVRERQKTIQEEKERRLQQEIQAQKLQEEAEVSLRETRRKAKEDREKRREEEAERRKKEVQRKREEKRKREFEMQKQEQEVEQQRTDREQGMAELRAQREREKELEEMAEEERREEERLRLLELEEEKKLEEERIYEAEEAVQRLIREREYREEMRKIAEAQQAKLETEESERRLREQQERAAIEEQRKRLEHERLERENKERERIRQLRQQEAIARIRAAHEASKRRAWALRRRERNMDRMAHLKSARQSQKLTDAFTFSYHVHMPRNVWELPYNWNSKKKRGGRSPVRKKKPSEEN